MLLHNHTVLLLPYNYLSCTNFSVNRLAFDAIA